jgi:hypothetical protein
MAIDPHTTPPTRYDHDVTTPRRNSGVMAFAVLLTLVVIVIAVWMVANDGEGGGTTETTSPTETTLPVETTAPTETTLAP